MADLHEDGGVAAVERLGLALEALDVRVARDRCLVGVGPSLGGDEVVAGLHEPQVSAPCAHGVVLAEGWRHPACGIRLRRRHGDHHEAVPEHEASSDEGQRSLDAGPGDDGWCRGVVCAACRVVSAPRGGAVGLIALCPWPCLGMPSRVHVSYVRLGVPCASHDAAAMPVPQAAMGFRSCPHRGLGRLRRVRRKFFNYWRESARSRTTWNRSRIS